MKFSDYEMTTPYPDYKNYSVEEVITRGGKVVGKKMVNEADAFKQAKKEYNQKQNELIEQFEEDLYLELGLVNHPKRNMDSKMISQKLDRQFVFEGVKLIIQLNDQNPGCDQSTF